MIRLGLVLAALVVLGALCVLALGVWDYCSERWASYLARQLADHERAIRAQDCANGLHRLQIVPSIRMTERCCDCGESWELGVALLTATNRKARRSV